MSQQRPEEASQSQEAREAETPTRGAETAPARDRLMITAVTVTHRLAFTMS